MKFNTIILDADFVSDIKALTECRVSIAAFLASRALRHGRGFDSICVGQRLIRYIADSIWLEQAGRGGHVPKYRCFGVANFHAAAEPTTYLLRGFLPIHAHTRAYQYRSRCQEPSPTMLRNFGARLQPRARAACSSLLHQAKPGPIPRRSFASVAVEGIPKVCRRQLPPPDHAA